MDLLGLVGSITMLNVIKFLLVVLLSVYSLFAMLMMRQIVAMTKAVAMRDDFVIRLLGTINFVFALMVLILAIFIL
ncbi:hypothetical protein COW38_04285 [Candidatus Collierbacteria bacterium CG17_big_fil_post_rev_8_21_14_2_50_45_7]|uniref:Uncharacterized protein n=2 Tax=Candidatus Collieribacteriota TaxID=1752725 RepID=A0A2H0WZ71_9BACT|nr:MAG: hypothetical protein COT54_01820 [Candidatus Collierbacteria bacterium CG09_land_8_20_14_0_10_46_12]PIW06776.1 MAG: hypothetical protein COW38_04285 [Candidatus Collierbacteria bacterium CG17_big_fil_post_rev_8_21_14_2_50_45_7]